MLNFPGKRGAYHFGAAGSFYDPKRGHTGEDYLMAENTPVPSLTGGRVILLRTQKEMGNCLYVKDEKENIVVYAHLNAFQVVQGESVEKGKILALSGNTGSATTAPHVHLEVISERAWPGWEHMVRTELAPFTGYCLPPEEYFVASAAIESPHVDDLKWLREHQIITKEHKPTDAVTWGELATVIRRSSQVD